LFLSTLLKVGIFTIHEHIPFPTFDLKYDNMTKNSLYIGLHSHDQYMWHTHFHISVQCTRSQLSKCHTASTTGLMGKHFYLGTLTKCLPSQCDHIPMTYVLSNSHQLTYQMIWSVYTQVTCLLIKYKWVMGMQRTSLELISKETMASIQK
jgi:hypothetical protein